MLIRKDTFSWECVCHSYYVSLPFSSILTTPTLTSHRVDVSIRIRRAIHLKDLTLLKRIIKNNPKSLQNPDFADNGNTSLHLAAQLGLSDIAVSKAKTLLGSLVERSVGAKC